MRLLRNTATGTPAEGIYDCVVEDDTLTTQIVFVGLYSSGGGIVSFHEIPLLIKICNRQSLCVS